MSDSSLPKLLLVGPLPPPYIGPAVATDRLARSPVLREMFRLELLDTADPEGIEQIGRFTIQNVREALGVGIRGLAAMVFGHPDAIYVPIDRAFWGFLRDLLLLVPARLLGVKVVVHLRAGRFDLIHDFGLRGRLLARLGLACATRVIVLGESLRDIFGHYVPSRKIAVVQNGLPLAEWPSPGDREDDDPFRILYLGNLFRDKGAHVMLAALPAIVRAIPNVRVTFAGDWIGAEFRPECERLVAEGGVGDHVEFAGRVDAARKQELLRGSDLLAFVPVKPEGSPWVVLEGMASGLPVIGTPQGTMREVIVDGETGYLIAPDDPAALAARVLELHRDPALRRRLGANGRSRLEREYSEEIAHRRLAAVVVDAIGKG